MNRRTFLSAAGAVLGTTAVFGARSGHAGVGDQKIAKGVLPGVIDMHIHGHRKRHPGVARPDGQQFPTPEILIEMMDNAGIVKAVLMSYVSPEDRYTQVIPEETLDICAQYPDRFIPFCCVDSRQLTYSTKANFRPMLSAYKELGCKGIGEYTTNIPMDDPLNLNLFRYADEVGFPLTFHLAHQIGGTHGCYDDIGLPRLEKVLKAFPNMIFIGHSTVFWSEIGVVRSDAERASYPKGPIKKEGRLVYLMRKYPNLHADLSAGSGYNAISRDPEFGYKFMEEFQDKLYFGTDTARYPYNLPIIPYFKELKEKRLITDVAFRKITWDNAVKLLHLEE